MTPQRRDLMLQVMNGEPQALHYLHHLNFYTRCDDILSWLIKSRLTGKEFIQWSRFSFRDSMLNMSKHILSRIEKTDKNSILYGIDFK